MENTNIYVPAVRISLIFVTSHWYL